MAPAARARTFRWSSAGDIPTLDIHSQNNALGNGVHAAIYESLVYYNSRSFKIEPMLATGWKLMNPTQLRVTLRQGVKFSDGSPMSADDVVFSLTRAMARTSNFGIYAQGIDRVADVVVDEGGTPRRPLFVNLDRRGRAGRLSGTAVYLLVRALGRKVGLTVRPHGLRHAAITAALDLTNGNVRAVRSFSRHARLDTLNLYDDRRTDLAGAVAALVAGDAAHDGGTCGQEKGLSPPP